MNLPFGKYRDRPITQVPTEYLEWMRDTVRFKSPKIRLAVIAELERRVVTPPESEEKPLTRLFRDWYFEMSLRHHPDRGGSTEGMQVVNDGYQLLLQLAKAKSA